MSMCWNQNSRPWVYSLLSPFWVFSHFLHLDDLRFFVRFLYSNRTIRRYGRVLLLYIKERRKGVGKLDRRKTDNFVQDYKTTSKRYFPPTSFFPFFLFLFLCCLFYSKTLKIEKFIHEEVRITRILSGTVNNYV